MVFPPTRVAYEALLKRVKELKEENERLRNVRSPAEVELQPKRRDRKASRNSWIDIYNENTTLHIHKMLLGQEVEIDDSLKWRVKWAQRGASVSCLLGLICWVTRQNIAAIEFAAIVFGALFLIFACILYYKNVSFVIAKRLLREPNVLIILVLILCNWSIDIAQPEDSLAPVNGLIYVLGVNAFAFVDAVKVKSRMFLIALGTLFVLLNMNNIYGNIFGDSNQGVVLLKYTIQGNEHTFMKRSTKLAIYIQIMLFSMNAVYILFKDRKMELMIFATGQIYRETGTASRDVEDKRYSKNIKLEKKSLSENIELESVVRSGNAWANAKPLSPAWILGVVAAISCGVFASIQYSAVTLGKEYEERKEGCFRNKTICSPRLAEEFNDLGSWYVSFGIGAMLVTLFCICLLACFRFLCRVYYRNDRGNVYHGLPLIPPLHFQVMKKPGAIAGLFWVLGNVFCTLAVVTGGNAIANAQMVAAMLITSGLWGILYYAEIRKGNAIVWGFFACLTLIFMVMLGLEKVA
eukprot:g12553.t1